MRILPSWCKPIVCLIALILATPLIAAEPFSWPHPAGPEFNRINRERNYSAAWNQTQYLQLTTEQPDAVIKSVDSDRPELWRIEGVSGRRSPLVFNNRLYLTDAEVQPTAEFVQEQTEASEQNLRPETVRWLIDCWYVKGRDPEARFRFEIPEPATSVTAEPELVADPAWRLLDCLTPLGNLYHLDSDSGDLLWQKSLADELAVEKIAAVATPLIFENLLIISCLTESAGTNGFSHQLLAIDRRNGQIFWKSASVNIASRFELSPPVLAVSGRQVCVACQRELGIMQLLQARTGRVVASLPLPQSHSVCAEVLYHEASLCLLSYTTAPDHISSWDLQLLREQQDGGQESFVTVLSHSCGPQSYVTSLLTDSYLIAAASEGSLRSWNLQDLNSQQRLSLESSGPHQLIGFRGELLLTSAEGRWEVFQLENVNPEQKEKPTGWKRVYAEQFSQPIVCPPILSKQSFYVRTPEEIVCLGEIDQSKMISDLLPDFSDQPQLDREVPTQILLTPARESLSAGMQLSLTCLAYSAQGEYLKTVDSSELDWEWNGPGEFDKLQGFYKAPLQLVSKEEVTIQVKWNQLTATATVQLIP